MHSPGSCVGLLALLCSCAIELGATVHVSQDSGKIPRDSVQLVVNGCLKGRVLTTTEPPEASGGELAVPVHRFQISGKKSLLAELKRHDREVVEVTGLVRKLDLKEPGLRVPGGRILITPGQSGDPHRLPTRPAERIIVIEVREFRPLDRDCEDY